MKRLLLAVSFAALLLSSTAVLAGGKGHGGHGNGHGNDHGNPGHGGTPPGLRKGGKIDVVYLQPKYYVDYHDHHLAAPPPGHRWVRDPDGRYILVAVATGIIADILLHH